MDERENSLEIILPDSVSLVDPSEINRAITAMVEESSDNIAVMEGLVLECSAALSSAGARNDAMSSRGFFKRCWDKITGADDRLRNAIEQDHVTAQYAMQQTIMGVMEECTRNRQLALVIMEKLDGEIVSLKNDINAVARNQNDEVEEVNKVRQALVRFYNGYQKQFHFLEQAMNRRCEYCREPLDEKQVICPQCGTIQELKMDKYPEETKMTLKEISQMAQRDAGSWAPDVQWNATAQRYAAAMAKARALANRTTILKDGDDRLAKDIDSLIEQCRSAEFQIAVVGVLKAGKSMLMNALIGVELASVGLNSETAALTKFRSSPQGHYIKVTFYTSAQWEKLNRDARKSGDEAPRNRTEDERTSHRTLWERLNKPGVQEEAQKWIGQQPVTERFEDLDKLRQRIGHWTSARSDEHLYAAEVEVGIDRRIFDMPEEVVFVDTPGLEDPVEYRSNITKEYIHRANAVLVAVRLAALRGSELSTIKMVYEYAGAKDADKRKVFLIGTQGDTLNSLEDAETIIAGREGWIENLISAGHYGSTRDEQRRTRAWKAASAQIYPTSAYLHLCAKKAMSLSDDELQDDDKFALDDYENLEKGIRKVVHQRRYALENLRCDTETQTRIMEKFGIRPLAKRLEDGLIRQYKELKLQDIRDEYLRCRRELIARSGKIAESYRNRVEKAKQGADALKEELRQKELAKKDIRREQENLAKALEALRQFTERKVGALSARKGER